MREMNQLVNTEDSAWPIIQNWLKDATNHTELLPVNKDLAETALYQLQVTTNHQWVRLSMAPEVC